MQNGNQLTIHFNSWCLVVPNAQKMGSWSLYLSTSVWQTKNLFLAKVTMDRENNDIKDCGYSTKELLHV